MWTWEWAPGQAQLSVEGWEQVLVPKLVPKLVLGSVLGSVQVSAQKLEQVSVEVSVAREMHACLPWLPCDPPAAF